MPDDREIAQRAIDFQARSRDYSMMELPGYMAWSERKLAKGEEFANIEQLDEMCMWCLPEEAAEMNDHDYDEMLEDLKASFEKDSQ